MISDILPLTPDQKLAEHRDDVAAQARLLQPAQLRIALLLTPVLCNTILHQLDHPPAVPPTSQDPGIILEPPTDDREPGIEPETPVDPAPEPDPE